VRYLLEELTGVASSSVYCDQNPPHMTKLFPWKAFCPKRGYNGERQYPNGDDLIVVKTHYPYFLKNMGDRCSYKKAVRVVRHPIDSFYSLKVWYWDQRKVKKPPGYVKEFIQGWRKYQEYWDKKEDVYTIRYEDLMDDPFSTLKGVAKELGLECTDRDIQRAVSKYPPHGKALKHLNKFSNRELDLIRRELADLLEEFNYIVPVKEKDLR